MKDKEEAISEASEPCLAGDNEERPALGNHSPVNQLLLDSLPHPAMLIDRNRQILAANRIAEQFGAKVGGYCWRDFARCEYLSESHAASVTEQESGILPEQIKCTFCLADQALAENRATNASEVNAFGRLWDIWWAPLDESHYLHYAIDITTQKQIEKELEQHRNELEKLVDARTEELKIVNKQLKIEIDERTQIEKALRESEERFRSMFEKSKAIKLLIDPRNGNIVDANPAACEFYGYQLDRLRSMKIFEINILPPGEIEEEMNRAQRESRNQFFFKHRLASGDVREVEVHSSPISVDGRELLFSIIHDITERRVAEELLKLEHNKFLSIANSTENAVFIFDADCNIQYLNPVAKKEFGPEIHRKCYEYLGDEGKICSWCSHQESKDGQSLRRVWTSPGTRKTYDVFSTPFQNPDGTTSTLLILHDVTEHKQIEQALRLDEARLAALLDLSQMTESPIEEITSFVLEQIVKLTDSKAGALVIINRDKTTFTACSLPKSDADRFETTDQLQEFPLGDAGFWDKAMNQREPIIVNEYVALHANPKDLAKDRVPLSRLLIAPVIAGNRVIAAAAAANKKEPYQMSDARQLMLLLDGMCKIIQRKESEDAIRESERQLGYLSKRLLTVQEQKKECLAKELHDTVGQTLAAIKYGLENAVKCGESVEYGTLIGSLQSLLPIVQKSIEDVRTMYTELRPTVLDDFGAIAALGWLCRHFNESYPEICIKKRFDIEEADVPQSLKIIIFRLVQEALNNIARHSEATLVHLSLCESEGRLILQIEDNGLGFDMKRHSQPQYSDAGLGLPSMKELVELSSGAFTVKSVLGQGTTIRTAWPKSV